MSATLRIHRGPASPDRVILLDGHDVGVLAEEVTDIAVPEGRHLVALKLGPYHSMATTISVQRGEVVDLIVEENLEAVLPIAQGGYLRFHHD